MVANWLQVWPQGKLRTARKSHRCDYSMGGGFRCKHVIEKKELYFDPGDSNPDSAGGFGNFRYCLQDHGEGGDANA
jgi:hypothetical protein